MWKEWNLWIKYLEKDFQDEIKGKRILVDFYANWCGPCRMLTDVLEEVSKKIDIDILKVDVDKFPEIAKNYNVFSIPALYILKDNEIEKSHVGFLNQQELLEFINEK